MRSYIHRCKCIRRAHHKFGTFASVLYLKCVIAVSEKLYLLNLQQQKQSVHTHAHLTTYRKVPTRKSNKPGRLNECVSMEYSYYMYISCVFSMPPHNGDSHNDRKEHKALPQPCTRMQEGGKMKNRGALLIIPSNRANRHKLC